MSLFANPQAQRHRPYGPQQTQWLSLAKAQIAHSELTTWPAYQPTPLHALPDLAAEAGLKQLWYKDEAQRFGLGSFKALGGAYAVFRQLAAQVERRTGIAAVTAVDLLSGTYRAITQTITVTTATDGNHGRSVAWGAQQFGCRCVIYLHGGVSQGREDAIAAYGAEIVRVPGNYDDSVDQAAQAAQGNGWILVSDTSQPGYTSIPCDVMQGYTVMVAEALDQIPDGELPTHLFVQAGVGGLAAAVCAYCWERYGSQRPTSIIVEPEPAASVSATARHGEPVTLEGNLETLMACLSAGHTSFVAWDILRYSGDFFLTIPDAAAVTTMGQLANRDPPIVAGESGAAGLAGVLAAAYRPDWRQRLGLTAHSRVLTFGTEGATDPVIYQQLVHGAATRQQQP